MTGGVTSFTISGTGNTGYTSAPTVTIAPPSISVTGTLNGTTSVTSVSSTTGLVPGMLVVGAGNNPCAIESISGSTITLTQPATVTGSGVTLTISGRTALATATINSGTGKVTAINVFVPGSGYSSGSPPTVTLAGGGFTLAATATATVTNTIATVPITSPGSGYTQTPIIAISDGGSGTGATAVALMGGVQPSDNVRYTAPDQWITSTVGPATNPTNVAIANYSGQLEPGVGTSYGFTLPTDQRVMGGGMNYGSTYYWAPYQLTGNWLKRVSPFVDQANGSLVITSTPDSRPLTVNGTAA